MSEDLTQTALIEMTADIVSNYVAANKISPEELPGLISSVHGALSNIGEPAAEPAEEFAKATAAQVRKSVSDAGIVSFLDGKTYQSLKRHLTTNGLTPTEYRERYGLPANYPMVSPAYAARRSELAKAIGLGQGGRKPKADSTRKTRAPKA